MGGGVGDGGKKDGRTDQGFKEAVPALVSLFCSPAQVYRVQRYKPFGRGQGLGTWAGERVEFVEGAFPSPARQTVRRLDCKTRQKQNQSFGGLSQATTYTVQEGELEGHHGLVLGRENTSSLHVSFFF